MMRAFTGICLLLFFSSATFCQTAGPAPSAASSSDATPPAFLLADIHQSPHTTFPFFSGAVLVHGDRYVMHNATMLDLIVTAYGIDAEKVLGGPSWLEADRFDVVAKVPPSTSADAIKPMLQTLLADRFHLVTHTDTKPVQAFVLTIGKAGKPKLKESDGSGNPGCQPRIDPPNPTPGVIAFLIATCHNVTMESFAQIVHQYAGGYLTSPVVDSTGLKGAWDFEFKWTGRGQLATAGADGISIFDAMDKQLGLKLELQKIPVPVIIVDSANENPTANPPGVATVLPAPAPAEFEVAVIKPSAPDSNGNFISAQPGGQFTIQGMSLKTLIIIAWDINPIDNDQLVGAPKWLDTGKFDVVAKASVDAPNQQVDFDDLRQMLRSLLEDRFKLVVHRENRPVDAYKLVADKPKLTKADPLNRTKCKEGPGADGKDPRIANPVLNRLVTCQNTTMADFSDQLRTLASGFIYSPVLDATGLEGGYNFTLSFSSAGLVRGGVLGGPPTPSQPATSAGGTPAASDPNGAISLFDAISKQLGLKLVKEKRPTPVLVIDHVEEKPTDN